MIDCRIKRIWKRDDGIFGSIAWRNFPVCSTLELPWRDNHPQTSCIPAGQFTCARVDSPHHGDTFEVTNVPGRTHILLHGANTIADLLGCIGLAEFYHSFNGRAGVANPYKGAAMSEFRSITAGIQSFTLEITEHF